MKLADIFTDNIVLQRNKPIRIFGSGLNTVSVDLNGIKGESENNGDRWMVTLPPMEAGGPYKICISDCRDKMELRNVMIGDVWLVAGQSNAEYPLLQDMRGMYEAEHCKNPSIRFYDCNRGSLPDDIQYWYMNFERPETNKAKPWKECDKNSAIGFSAIGYYVSKRLYKEINVPIGVISANMGGVPIETFLPEEAFANPVFEEYKKDFDSSKVMSDEETDRFIVDYAKKTVEEKAQIDKSRHCYEDMVSRMGHEAAQVVVSKYKKIEYLPVCKYHSNAPSVYYNKMIKGQIAPFSMRGVIWYQGESNTGKPDNYCEKFKVMTEAWRKLLNDAELPFYTVEIAPFEYPAGRKAYIIREEQQKAAKEVENCYIATTQNLGNETDIHPLQKLEVAERISKQILNYEYKQNCPCEGPKYKDYEIHGNEIRIFVENDTELVGYDNENMMIAGTDGVYKKAEVEIRDNQIIAKSAEVSNPVSARYCYKNYYKNAHIYNAAGIPLAPFTTEKDN